MSDKRRNPNLKEVRLAIIDILASQPMQAKDLKKALEKKTLEEKKGIKYNTKCI